MEGKVTMSANLVTWPDYICKIEGHGSLKVSFDKDTARLNVLEGERLFEGMLLGRSLYEAPFITARICGVCPTVHSVTAYQGAEAALGIGVSEPAARLRKVLLAAQSVQSHALHVFVLALPDYLGLDNAIEIAGKHPNEFAIALRLKDIGDRTISVIGGRPVHPLSVTIGGFSKLPELEQLETLHKAAGERIADAEATVELLKTLNYPKFARPTEYFSLKSPDEYATYGDAGARIASSKGFDSEIMGYRAKGGILEVVKDYSTAKFGTHGGHGIMVGSLARLNVNKDKLHPKARKAFANSKIELGNIFHNVPAQGIEMIHYLEDIQLNLKWLIDNGVEDALAPKLFWKAGEGAASSEAPRGTLYYYYKVDRNGVIGEADIITPTAQNLTNIEEDANQLLVDTKGKPTAERKKLLDMLLRAYDPCLSCAAH